MMNIDPDIYVIGSVNWDYIIRVPDLSNKSTSYEGHSFYEGPGGRGLSQSIAASRLGKRVSLICRIADDKKGRKLLTLMKEEDNLDCSRVIIDLSDQSGTSLIAVDEKENKTFFYYPGVNQNLCFEDLQIKEDINLEKKILLTQMNLSLRELKKIIHWALKMKMRIILDPAPAKKLTNEILRGIELIKANHSEAEILTGVHVKNIQDAKIAADKLLGKGVKSAIISVPHEGNYIKTHTGQERWMPLIGVKSVDPVGAGDAFIGTMAAFLSEGLPIEEAFEFGMYSAAMQTRKEGAIDGIPSKKELFDFKGQGEKNFEGRS